MERQLAVKDVAEKLDIDENLLLRELKTAPANLGGETVPAPAQKVPRKREEAEKGLVAFLILGGELWADLVFSAVSPDLFAGRETGLLYRALLDDRTAGKRLEASALFDRFREDDQTTAVLGNLASAEIAKGLNLSQFGLDCVLRLVEQSHHELIDSIQRRMKKIRPVEDDGLKQEWVNANKTLENAKFEITSRWKKNVEF